MRPIDTKYIMAVTRAYSRLSSFNMVKSSTKYAVIVKDPNEIKYHLQKAYHISTEGRPGPVWIDIPADIHRFTLLNH